MPDVKRSEFYPRFTEQEYAKRRTDVRKMMRDEGVEALIIYGDDNDHNVNYLANYRFGQKILVFFADEDQPPTLFVFFANHVQFAREMSVIDNIRWAGHHPIKSVAALVNESIRDNSSIGIVAPGSRNGFGLPHGQYIYLAQNTDCDLKNLTKEFNRIQLIMSSEEIEWLEKGANMTSSAMGKLESSIEPGMKESELRSVIESEYLLKDGETVFTFLSSTSMKNPSPKECMPWKVPSNREIQRGDIITTEFTGTYGGYMGQIHRPISVCEKPSPIYQDLYDVAKNVYDNILSVLKPGNSAEDVVDAAQPIIEAGYVIDDPIVHGWGTSLRPPWIGNRSESSNYWPATDHPMAPSNGFTFQENMSIVVQPNLFTKDWRQGLQLGNSVIITNSGPRVMEDYPINFINT